MRIEAKAIHAGDRPHARGGGDAGSPGKSNPRFGPASAPEVTKR